MEIYFRYVMKGIVFNVLEICGLFKLFKFFSCILIIVLKIIGFMLK